MLEIQTIEQIKKEIDSKEPILIYFSGENCSVCKVLKPKIESEITNKKTQSINGIDTVFNILDNIGDSITITCNKIDPTITIGINTFPFKCTLKNDSSSLLQFNT